MRSNLFVCSCDWLKKGTYNWRPMPKAWNKDSHFSSFHFQFEQMHKSLFSFTHVTLAFKTGRHAAPAYRRPCHGCDVTVTSQRHWRVAMEAKRSIHTYVWCPPTVRRVLRMELQAVYWNRSVSNALPHPLAPRTACCPVLKVLEPGMVCLRSNVYRWLAAVTVNANRFQG